MDGDMYSGAIVLCHF